MHALYILSVWLHLLAAMTWIGGMVFLALVLVPACRLPAYQGIATSLVHVTGVRFRVVGWICLGVLLLTGTFNLAYRGLGLSALLSGPAPFGFFGQILRIKLPVVAAIFLISARHDFVIGPRATAVGSTDPASAEARRLRAWASWMGRVNLLLGLAVVALGVMLVRGWPW